MVLLPRLARRLNSPAIATLLALILIAVGIVGIVTDDIPTRWAVVVLIVGVINVIRALPYRRTPE
jgi:isoprenylcysteine carboxyl methyltransferase (ICMT) family protein YpbQ